MSTTTQPPSARSAGRRRIARAVGFGLLGIVLLASLWELYKFLGPADGVAIGDVMVLPKTDDKAMPHLWDIGARLVEPTNVRGEELPMGIAVLEAVLVTLQTAAVAWIIGLVLGVALAIVMDQFRIAQKAMLPWIVLSQTVPIIAFASVVVGWGGKLSIGDIAWEKWMSVAVIAAYLAFYPIAIGMFNGLRASTGIQQDLFTSYATGFWRRMFYLKLPTSVPYLIPALRLSAANALVGTVVAEIATGTKGGIGRMIIEFGKTATSDPPKAFAPIVGIVLLGLIIMAVTGLANLALRRYRTAEQGES